ncbi:hypothetical protein [Sulfuracidifex tepidarius]|uniref:Uncharacterized protein n=1 Tax=Sulfuracidifex tepidarius TaxID=1294262 RepID=A0A510DVM3_9CREN|nr:hypothetical protein [Sulfuracidifex tepidarius]BBG24286.1 hypothetical protein IC006_1595 [Sulfuracidifex tepidarius]BBG27043.1 hypothetical protein IC007_1572 [Sulfuracidifex tepidarius]
MSRAISNKRVIEIPGVYRSWFEVMTWIEKAEDFGPVGVIEGMDEIESLLNELSFKKMEYDRDTDIYEKELQGELYRVYVIKSSSFIAGELFSKGIIKRLKEFLTRKSSKQK